MSANSQQEALDALDGWMIVLEGEGKNVTDQEREIYERVKQLIEDFWYA